MKKKISLILIIFLLAAASISGSMMLKKNHLMNQEKAAFEKLQKQHLEEGISSDNSECIGWLKVDGTAIDYPVMHTPREPLKYLHLSYEGEYSYSGTPFLDGRCDMENSDVLIVYGHNMLNQTMFSTLSYFEEEAFYMGHHKIYLETEDEIRCYEVIGVIKTDVDTAEQEVFSYISGSWQEYEKYVKNLLKLYLYDTGLRAGGEQLLVLSTCSYHTEDGRFIVIGKRT